MPLVESESRGVRTTLLAYRPVIIGLFLSLIVLVMILLFNVSKPGDSFEGCLSGCARTIDERATKLRIASLNVLHGYPDYEAMPLRLELIAAEIKRLEVDIMLLQEVPWTRAFGNGADLLATASGMNYVYYRANGNRHLIGFEEGEAIFSRFPLHDVRFAELQPRAGFFENRIVLQALTDTPQGPIRLFVTHLTNGEKAVNQKQAAALEKIVGDTAEVPTIVAGDLNATEDTPQYLSIAENWIDVYRSSNKNDPGFTCCQNDLFQKEAQELNHRIDYIFWMEDPEKRLQLQDVKLAFDQPYQLGDSKLWLSDHLGLLAIFKEEVRDLDQ